MTKTCNSMKCANKTSHHKANWERQDPEFRPETVPESVCPSCIVPDECRQQVAICNNQYTSQTNTSFSCPVYTPQRRSTSRISPMRPALLQRVAWTNSAHIHAFPMWQPLMMIAFITIKSSLVPLIEGLCAQIHFRFEISVVCSHLLVFSFVKEKTC